MRFLKVVSIAAFVALLFGCASGPKIQSLQEPGIDFGAYKTFNFVPQLEENNKQYSSFFAKFMKQAITNEMAARGVSLSDDPDLLVNFYLHTKEKISSTTGPSASASYYGGYRSRYGYSYGLGYGTETRVTQYTQGTLHIDVVDKEKNTLVWEGVAIGKIKEKHREKLEETTNASVQQIFTRYPVPAPAAAEQ